MLQMQQIILSINVKMRPYEKVGKLMKVVKRDGRIIEYDRNKINIALEKANASVSKEHRITQEEIDVIINYIENLDKKRILVEDIQDIIEIKLMELKKYILAKKYIVYRYNRTLIRKQNTTDETILGMIRKNLSDQTNNNSSKSIKASIQRDRIAKEISKDLTERLLLPSKITTAITEGKIYFHNPEYFLQPIFNSSILNIKDMLENNTVINNHLIESPKSFLTACNVLTQIIFESSTCQYGNISIDIGCLGKYYHKSYEKHLEELKKLSLSIDEYQQQKIIELRLKNELKNGIQALIYQINTLKSFNENIKISFFIYDNPDDNYRQEKLKIYEELIKQKYKGIKNTYQEYEKIDFFEIIYVLRNNDIKDDLTSQIIKLINDKDCINIVSELKMRELYNDQIASPLDDTLLLPLYKDTKNQYKFAGRFNQGIVSLNLPQIALEARGQETTFFELLEERLELCFEALMCRHYALLATSSLTSPIHYEYGGIARAETKNIDNLFKKGYSTLNIGYFGINELNQIIETNNCDFSLKVIKYLKQTLEKYSKEKNLAFCLSAIKDKEVIDYFYKIDEINLTKYNIKKYTQGFNQEQENLYERLELEQKFQNLTTGGSIIEISNIELDNNLINYIYENLLYTKIDNREGRVKNDEKRN